MIYARFIADKESSEEYGLICVSFDEVSGAEKVSGGCKTELITEKTPRSNTFNITSQEYSEPLSFTFQVINEDASDIEEIEERMIKKWLCKRGKYIDFYIDDIRFYDKVFNVNIHDPQIIKVNGVNGMEFTATCKYPYALSTPIVKLDNITTQNQQIKLYIDNDDDSYIYPDIVITANASGTLSITNNTELDNHVFTINNLTVGEVITIAGNTPDISSSISSHDVWVDFNKHWLRFVDGYNMLTVSNLCTIKLTYSEPRKVGV